MTNETKLRATASVTVLLLFAATGACKNDERTGTLAPVDAGAPGALATATGAATASASSRSLRRPPSPTSAVAHEFGRRGGSTSGACNGAEAGPAAFGLYVLALSWAPEFCNRHTEKEECAPLSQFASTHLTLHGLWPNYDDRESAKRGCEYPQYCGGSSKCSRDDPSDDCSLDRNAMPADMKTYGPGYVGDDDFLAAHEWPKHGSCTGLSEHAYFAAALSAMKAVGGDSGTPKALSDAIGSSITPATLVASFAHPESILLGCDDRCELTEVSVCLSHDPSGVPGASVACPDNARTSTFDNGCVTRKCAAVTVRKAGTHDAPRPSDARGGQCSHPGQGPSCSSDSVCTAAGYSRCARSGCCTSVPLR